MRDEKATAFVSAVKASLYSISLAAESSSGQRDFQTVLQSRITNFPVRPLKRLVLLWTHLDAFSCSHDKRDICMCIPDLHLLCCHTAGSTFIVQNVFCALEHTNFPVFQDHAVPAYKAGPLKTWLASGWSGRILGGLFNKGM